jgi:pimeloyl-ACP methyl ester carboxylesterase
MPYVNLVSGPVHYSEQGHGVPLILLHANPGDSLDYEAVILALSKNYRVLALDWPGYGQSPSPKQIDIIDVVFFCQVLREFLSALELPPVFLIGNSLGGNAAARLAIENPELVRGLVLVAPGGFTSPNFLSRSFCKLQGSRFSFSPYRFASLYLKLRTVTTRAMLERASTTQAAVPQISLNRTIWRSFSTSDNDLRSIAKNIKVPSLLIFGKYDPVIPANKDGKLAASLIPDAKSVTLPCGHVPFAELPQQFLVEVQAFLNGK